MSKDKHYRKPVNTDNYQQCLDPSPVFKKFISHGHRTTDSQLDKGIVVGWNTFHWHNKDYWLPLIMVSCMFTTCGMHSECSGKIYQRGYQECHKLVAHTLQELKFKVKNGLLKSYKLKEE